MMFEYNVPITVVRGSGPDEQRLSMDAMDFGDSYSLPVTADIREGDQVEQVMPSGVTRTVHITQVKVFQMPGGDDDLDNTQAFYSSAPPAAPSVAGATTWNVTATNMQVATGPHAHQTMNVGTTTKHLQDLIKGIAELMVMSGAIKGTDAELERVRDEAVAQVAASMPDAGAVQRFAEWVSERAKAGAGTAVSAQASAAINAALSALVQNAQALAQIIPN
ncbi:hypothetical protein [Promicromonospora sp. NPDC023805]|uniref:hypothetical protein n=1 Tax=Promicromonospora sp. NPDC023805 TaxID=3154696 RepID=UPI0033D7A570